MSDGLDFDEGEWPNTIFHGTVEEKIYQKESQQDSRCA